MLIMGDANLCSLNAFTRDMQLNDKLFVFIAYFIYASFSHYKSTCAYDN